MNHEPANQILNAEPRTANLRDSARGIALVVTLLLTSLLTALGLALMLLSTGESWLSAAYRTSEELSYAADAAVARVQIDLTRAADWTPLLSSSGAVSSLNDGSALPRLTDSTTLDLDAETRALQAKSDALYGSADPDRPVWRLLAHAPLSTLTSGSPAPAIYLAAWIADDREDGDGNPQADANGRVYVHAEAFAPAGARRGTEATLGRAAGPGPSGAPSGVQMLAWRELR
jgi:hypothetical protein